MMLVTNRIDAGNWFCVVVHKTIFTIEERSKKKVVTVHFGSFSWVQRNIVDLRTSPSDFNHLLRYTEP